MRALGTLIDVLGDHLKPALDAWHRLGVATSIADLAGRDPAELREALKVAVRRGLITKDAVKQADKLIRETQAASLEHTLKLPMRSGDSTIADVFALSSLPADQAHAIVRRFLNFPGAPNDFWQVLAKDSAFTDGAARLRLTLELGVLVDFHKPLLEALVARQRRGEFASPRDLVKRDTAWWEHVIGKLDSATPLPNGLTGRTRSQSIKSFTHRIVDSVARAFPTAALAERLGGEKDAGVLRVVGTARDGLNTLLKHHPDLDLLTMPVPQLLALNPSLRLGASPGEQLRARGDLVRLQRLFRLTGDYAQFRALAQAGFDSAHAIRREGRRAFCDRMGPLIGGVHADIVYRRAVRAADVALNIWATFSPAVHQTSLTALNTNVANLNTLFGASSGCSCEHCSSVYGPAAYFVDLLTFLAHRRTSPVASAVLAPVRPLLEVLLGRRPDLAELELSCDNTNTLVPVVDLTLEVLEREVGRISIPGTLAADLDTPQISPALQNGLTAKGVTLAPDATVEVVEADLRWVIRQPGLRVAISRLVFASSGLPPGVVPGSVVPNAPLTVRVFSQSIGSAEEMAAYPPFVNPAAYATVAGAARPWTLPFHLPLSEVRAALRHLGVPRFELMESTATVSDLRWRDLSIALEQIGMTRRQAQLTTGAAPEDAWQLWGVDRVTNTIADPLTPSIVVQGDGLAVLAHASVFLQRSGLTFGELLSLLEMRFVNPPDAAGVRPLGLTNNQRCNPSEAQLQGLDEAALKRVHQFVRLWRALGWSMADVDLAIHVLAQVRGTTPSTDDTVLIQCAQIRRLQARLGVPVGRLLGSWAPIATHTYRDPLAPATEPAPSLFDQIFQSRVTSRTGTSPFRLNTARTELAVTTLKLSDVSAEVGSALNLTAAEIDTFDAGIPDALNLATLSELHRRSVLARALGLSAADYLNAVSVIGDPFTVPPAAPADFYATEATLRFIDAVDFARDAGFSIAEIDVLLRQQLPSDGRSGERDAADRALVELRDELSRIADLPAKRSHVVAKLSERLLLDAPVVHELTSAVLPSTLDPALHLIDDVVAAASSGGLSANYFDNSTLTAPAVHRQIDPLITFDWTAAPPPAPVNAANFSARWAGGVRVQATGLYTFSLTVHGTARVTVAGQLQIDQTAAAGPTTVTAAVDLEAGLLHDLELVYISAAASPALDLQVTGPGAATLVPEDARLGLVRLHQVARLAKRLEFTSYDLFFLFRTGATAGWLTFADLPVRPASSAVVLFPRWRRLVELSQVKKVLPADAVFELMAEAPLTTTTESQFLDRVSERLEWNRADLEFLKDAARWGFGRAAFQDERLLVRLYSLFTRLRRLGLSAQDGWSFTRDEDDPAFPDSAATRQVVRAREAQGAWLEGLAVVRDELRDAQQRALVAYLVDTRGLTDAAALSEQLLTDVEMTACQKTTRLKQAISTVQTFVQRCQLNLEPAISAAPEFDPAWRQWEWMKNYRVWEASRKVFLYPENWLEPELRDDKSPFFRELESELLQGDLTDDMAEAVIERYLEKLHEVARLDIRAMCEQPADAADPEILHVIGRTPTPPHVYYHRQRVSDGSWTAWKTIDVDIEGDHLMAVVSNRRLTLLWPVFTEQNEPPDAAAASPSSTSTVPPELANKSWKVQIAWSEFRRDAWSAKKVSSASLRIPLYLELVQGTPQTIVVSPGAGAPTGGFGVGTGTAVSVQPATPAVFIAQEIDKSSVYFQALDENALSIECYSRPSRHVPTAAKPDEIKHEERIDQAIAAGKTAFEEFLGLWAQIPFLQDVVAAPFDFLSVAERPSTSWADDIGGFAKDAALLGFDEGIAGYFALTPHPVLHAAVLAAMATADVGMTRSKLSSVLNDLSNAHEDDEAISESALKAALDEKLRDRAKDDDPNPFGGDGSGVYAAREATGIPELARKTLRIAIAIVGAVEAKSPPRNVAPQQADSHFHWGTFTIDCGDRARVVPKQPPAAVSGDLLPNTETAFNSFREEQNNDTLQLHTGAKGATAVLRATPGRFVVARPGAIRERQVGQPFVYQDASRAFLAKQQQAKGLLTLPGLNAVSSLMVKDTVVQFDAAVALKSLGIGKPQPPSGLVIPGKLPPNLFGYPLWLFETLEHPYVCRLRETLARHGVKGLLRRTTQQTTKKYFSNRYRPTWTETLDDPYPIDRVDFSFDGAYSIYNWELFFHIPLLIATQLGKNQRFEDAQKWFHYIFDPTANSGGASPSRFWKTLPLFETSHEDYAADQADSLLQRLASGNPDPGLEAQVEDWRSHPFSPHRIARLRTTAYQKAVVMRYIDTLIQWGDQLFRRETLEALNEAAGLYAFAARILGPRPQVVPPSVPSPVRTWSSLEATLAPHLLEDLEVFVPLPSLDATAALDSDVAELTFPDPGVFCVPQNDKLLGYWDTVADRLFKIRHCMHIEGAVRQLPPFEPPIDPGLLVRAAAAGVDIASVLGDVSTGAPPYRFMFMIQKALELCGEVRSLGASLLSAIEKRDGEALAALRSTHETGLLQAIRRVREQQVAEARAGREALDLSRRVIQTRFDYYDSVAFLNPMEAEHLDLLGSTLALQSVQSGVDLFGNLIALIPNTKIGAPTTLGLTFGGDNLAQAMRAFSSYLGSMISILGTTGSLTATMGGYSRRADEWKLQRDLAAGELKQLDKQIVAAELREAITALELANHERQLADARQVESFLKTKYTNEELFGWMSGELSSLYFQTYRLAYDIAKRAEAACRLELGVSDMTFIQFGYWDTLKKGLLAGDRLALDLRRLESAYLEKNVRDAELTRHVSLALLNPRELLRLKQLGTCVIDVPEALFDLDHAGHYLRRVKSISVTIPCVTGPYTGVPCRLTLLKSQIRIKPDTGPGYQPVANDPRIVDVPPPAQALFLSSGQGDAGLFETNLRDERFLPFEGHGAVSKWRLELPNDFRPFDFDTIADVILHVRYTAKDGGEPLKTLCASELRAALNAVVQGAGATGFARLFVLRQEAPDRFHAFLRPIAAATQHEITVSIVPERFPFVVRNKTIQPAKIEVFVKVQAPSASVRAGIKLGLDVAGAAVAALPTTDDMGMLRAEKSATSLGDWTLVLWHEVGGVKTTLPPGVVVQEVFVTCYYTLA